MRFLKRPIPCAAWAVLACPIASTSLAGDGGTQRASQPAEFRLSERTRASAPPIIARPSYEVDARELLPGAAANSELRAVTKLPPDTFLPARSYQLTFTARAAARGPGRVSVKFRTASHDTYRTFQALVTGPNARHYQLDFTAPAYVAEAELAIEGEGTPPTIEAPSLRMRAPLESTEPVRVWSGSYVPGDYGLVFNDEFDGPELDRSKWFTRFIYSSEQLDRLNKENQRYSDRGNHRIEGGVLYLTAKRLKLSQPSGMNYESGMIRSDFTARYGFFEARVKMPGGLGVWPAFWLNSDVSETGRLGWPPEIDIFEFVNNGKEDKLNQLHSSNTKTPGLEEQFVYAHPNFKTSIKDYFAPFNFNEGWHTIGAEWTPSEVTLFVDGLKVVTTTFQWLYADGTPAGPAHVLLNLAIGDNWAGRHGIDDSAFPQALAIDWVRVYQKLNTGQETPNRTP